MATGGIEGRLSDSQVVAPAVVANANTGPTCTSDAGGRCTMAGKRHERDLSTSPPAAGEWQSQFAAAREQAADCPPDPPLRHHFWHSRELGPLLAHAEAHASRSSAWTKTSELDPNIDRWVVFVPARAPDAHGEPTGRVTAIIDGLLAALWEWGRPPKPRVPRSQRRRRAFRAARELQNSFLTACLAPGEHAIATALIPAHNCNAAYVEAACREMPVGSTNADDDGDDLYAVSRDIFLRNMVMSYDAVPFLLLVGRVLAGRRTRVASTMKRFAASEAFGRIVARLGVNVTQAARFALEGAPSRKLPAFISARLPDLSLCNTNGMASVAGVVAAVAPVPKADDGLLITLKTANGLPSVRSPAPKRARTCLHDVPAVRCTLSPCHEVAASASPVVDAAIVDKMDDDCLAHGQHAPPETTSDSLRCQMGQLVRTVYVPRVSSKVDVSAPTPTLEYTADVTPTTPQAPLSYFRPTDAYTRPLTPVTTGLQPTVFSGGCGDDKEDAYDAALVTQRAIDVAREYICVATELSGAEPVGRVNTAVPRCNAVVWLVAQPVDSARSSWRLLQPVESDVGRWHVVTCAHVAGALMCHMRRPCTVLIVDGTCVATDADTWLITRAAQAARYDSRLLGREVDMAARVMQRCEHSLSHRASRRCHGLARSLRIPHHGSPDENQSELSAHPLLSLARDIQDAIYHERLCTSAAACAESACAPESTKGDNPKSEPTTSGIEVAWAIAKEVRSAFCRAERGRAITTAAPSMSLADGCDALANAIISACREVVSLGDRVATTVYDAEVPKLVATAWAACAVVLCRSPTLVCKDNDGANLLGATSPAHWADPTYARNALEHALSVCPNGSVDTLALTTKAIHTALVAHVAGAADTGLFALVERSGMAAVASFSDLVSLPLLAHGRAAHVGVLVGVLTWLFPHELWPDARIESDDMLNSLCGALSTALA